ncbi:MAG: class B sortase [Ruminococcus sp.]|nr:class B sortase [Ruminococcus sp.]
MKKLDFKETIRRVVFIVCAVALAVSLFMFFDTLTDERQAQEDKKINQSIADTTVATYIDTNGEIAFIKPTEVDRNRHNDELTAHYSAINPDYIGYIWVPGCDISDPVVRGENNEEYLATTYYGASNKAGAIFMDWRTVVTKDSVSPNIVLYGHNQKDGTMFGNLKNYRFADKFYQQNPFIQFNTIYDVGDYVIFAYFVTNALPEQDSEGEVFRYHDYNEQLRDENTFYTYLDEVYKRSYIIPPFDVRFGDQLLTLSTCSTEFRDSRFVVFARKLRPGETEDSFDFTLTEQNLTRQGIDWDAIRQLDETEKVTEIPEEYFYDGSEVYRLPPPRDESVNTAAADIQGETTTAPPR